MSARDVIEDLDVNFEEYCKSLEEKQFADPVRRRVRGLTPVDLYDVEHYYPIDGDI